MDTLHSVNPPHKVSEIDLVYRSYVKASERPVISNSSDAYHIFNNYWNLDKIDFIEEFKILLLNRANKVLALFEISSGGITGTVADTRVMFAAALRINAVAIIMAHNHPSGNLRPSQADEELTRKVNESGNFLDIKLLDHLIIADEDYFSFADNGLL